MSGTVSSYLQLANFSKPSSGYSACPPGPLLGPQTALFPSALNNQGPVFSLLSSSFLTLSLLLCGEKWNHQTSSLSVSASPFVLFFFLEEGMFISERAPVCECKNPNLMWFLSWKSSWRAGSRRADPVAQPSHQRSRVFSSLCSHPGVGFIWEIVALMVIGMAASSGLGLHASSFTLSGRKEWILAALRRVGASFLEVPPSAFLGLIGQIWVIPIPGPITVSEEQDFLS